MPVYPLSTVCNGGAAVWLLLPNCKSSVTTVEIFNSNYVHWRLRALDTIDAFVLTQKFWDVQTVK